MSRNDSPRYPFTVPASICGLALLACSPASVNRDASADGDTGRDQLDAGAAGPDSTVSPDAVGSDLAGSNDARSPAADAATGSDRGGDVDAGTCDPYDPGADPFAPSLAAWWTMEQDTQDQSSHGHHCAAVGNAHLVQDAQRGGVIELDGDGDYLDCGNGAALDPSQTLSLALWVRLRGAGTPWQSFLSRNGEDCGWNLRRDEGNAGADFALRGTSATDDLRGSRAIDDGAWHHLAGVYDGVRRTLYVDGEIDAQWLDSGAVPTCPADHVLVGAMGAESFGYGHLAHDGWLDDVRIYGAALDQPAVLRLAGKGQAANSPSPANGAHCVDLDTTLAWQPGLGSCGHYVYLGNDEDAVRSAQDPNTPPGRGRVLESQLDPGPLQYYTTYYWRVDEVAATGIAQGPVWSFSVCGQTSDGFVRIPAGNFTMGASPGDSQACRTSCGWPFDIEKPHQVNITRDFWIKATEVTHGEWVAVFGSTPGVFAACGNSCPVENISWWQMLAYCNQRSAQEGLPPCYYTDGAGTAAYDMNAANNSRQPYWVEGLDCLGYRLPTEAEWEYAARAGTTTPVFLGAATDANVQQIAWYGANSGCSYARCEEDNCRSGAGNIPPSGPQPVAQKLPNSWGLYDTSGNVWEFVWDFFGEYHDGPVDDPSGPVDHAAGFHVARGGSWLNGTVEARASTRDGDDGTCDFDNGPGSHTGFRIARTAP